MQIAINATLGHYQAKGKARDLCDTVIMKQLAALLTLASSLAIPALSQNKGNPLVGRWDFNMTSQGGTRAVWLGVTEKAGVFDVWYQPSGGNVYQLKDFKVDGSHMTITISPAASNRPAVTWELEASGDKLTGFQKRGENASPLAGVRAPDLKRAAPAAWTTPEPLFNGRNLDGWEPTTAAENHWVARNGELVNEAHGANLKTTRKFDDFKLHIEFNCPDGGNSGIYLRGRYEVQVEYEPPASEPPERGMGSIYGRLTPADMPRTPGQWESFDITLVGRTLAIVRNGVTIIDHKEIEGITGGALDADEGEPGPFYIQGDHTGGLRFRNITISVPRR